MGKANAAQVGRIRNQHGTLVEAGAVLIATIPVVLCLFDMSVLFLAAMQNDSVCRNLARTASIGEPREVKSRVEKALSRQRGPFMLEQNLRLDNGYPLNDAEVRLNPQELGPVNGRVTVRVSADVRPPFLLKHFFGKDVITMQSQQTFPYTFIRSDSSDEPN